MGTPSPPPFFVTAHSKGVTDAIFVSAHSKGVIGGQFRPKPRKTRCLLVSAHSEGVRGEVASASEAEEVENRRYCPEKARTARISRIRRGGEIRRGVTMTGAAKNHSRYYHEITVLSIPQ